MARLANALPVPERHHQPRLRLVEPARKIPRKRRLKWRFVAVYLAAVSLVSLVVVTRIAIEYEESRSQVLVQGIASAKLRETDLELEVAQLSSPQRVIGYASTHLGLSQPSYLDVIPGSSPKGSVALPQSEGSTPQIPLPAGTVTGG